MAGGHPNAETPAPSARSVELYWPPTMRLSAGTRLGPYEVVTLLGTAELKK